MQFISIVVARTRDMRGLDVSVTMRGVDGQPTQRKLWIRTLSWREPVSMTREDAIALAQGVAEALKVQQSARELPF